MNYPFQEYAVARHHYGDLPMNPFCFGVRRASHDRVRQSLLDRDDCSSPLFVRGGNKAAMKADDFLDRGQVGVECHSRKSCVYECTKTSATDMRFQ